MADSGNTAGEGHFFIECRSICPQKCALPSTRIGRRIYQVFVKNLAFKPERMVGAGPGNTKAIYWVEQDAGAKACPASWRTNNTGLNLPRLAYGNRPQASLDADRSINCTPRRNTTMNRWHRWQPCCSIGNQLLRYFVSTVAVGTPVYRIEAHHTIGNGNTQFARRLLPWYCAKACIPKRRAQAVRKRLFHRLF